MSSGAPTQNKIPLAAIVAGGKARRMGADKAVLLLEGVPLIERVWARVATVSARLVTVGGVPRLGHLGVPTIQDFYTGADSLGGIATALRYASAELGPRTAVLCVACDMPLLEPNLLLHLYRISCGWDVVVPRVEAGYEPLCAVYRVTCLPVMEGQIGRANFAVRGIFRSVRTLEVKEEELRGIDPDLLSFLNVNRPGDLDAAREALSQRSIRAV